MSIEPLIEALAQDGFRVVISYHEGQWCVTVGHHTAKAGALYRALQDACRLAGMLDSPEAQSPSAGAPLPAREGAGGMGAMRHLKGGDA